MQDYMVRASANDDTIRAFAVTSKVLTEEARVRHNLSPICTAALGRAMSAGLMMGYMMKNDRDLLTLVFSGNGPMRGLTVTANNRGEVKGFVNVPNVFLPDKVEGHLNVGGAMGQGSLRVMKDTGLKTPYTGAITLQSGEIADDLTYYFAVSEQIPSAVGLGVLINKDMYVDDAGGFIVQVMPEADNDTISLIEENIKKLPPVTNMLSAGLSPEDMISNVLSGLKVRMLDSKLCSFNCDCSREKVKNAILTLSKEDIQEMVNANEPIETVCQFCGKKYVFSPEEIRDSKDMKAGDIS